MPAFSRGFRGRRVDVDPARVPPGQYVTRDFPVLPAGPTPRDDDEPGFWEAYGHHKYGYQAQRSYSIASAPEHDRRRGLRR